MKEMPSLRSIRDLTESRASIEETVTCLPTSRRKPSRSSPALQSRLLTIVPGSVTSTNLLACARMAATLASRVSSSSRGRSVSRPEGSPMRPVAPPTSTSARWPARAKRASVISCCRCPACSESAVGSNPQYRVMGPSLSRRSSESSSVLSAISPRACRSVSNGDRKLPPDAGASPTGWDIGSVPGASTVMQPSVATRVNEAERPG